MTFYLVGLGLNEKSVTMEALELMKKCKRVYIEEYTVELPYSIEKLERNLKVEIVPLTRVMVESERFVEEAKNKDIALLVYGSPLSATTHISLLLKCRKEGIKYRVMENAGILDAVLESGLQVYKFGKTASMPLWTSNYKPTSFVNVISDNKKIDAHSLILVDIGLSYGDALKQLAESCKGKIKLGKIIACSQLGTENSRFFYDNIPEIAGREVFPPFCFIIPGKLHFLEEEALKLICE